MYEKLKQIANIFKEAKDNIQTEEATKNALIMPFISALGFNPFNPLEVVPEIVADIGDKKGEKVDYALKSGDKTLMLVECKKCTVPLSDKNISQVFRYFGALRVKMDVRVAILTNGLEYRFFSDLDSVNVLDHVPFFSFDILDFDEQKVQDLQRFSKNQFDVDSIVAKAEELKRRAVVENVLDKYMTNPSESLVRCVLSDIAFEGTKTKDVLASYAVVIKDAFSQVLKNKIESVLKTALRQDVSVSQENEDKAEPSTGTKGEIETTVTEIEGYAIVKSIAREVISPARIFFKDTKQYSYITLDDETYRQKPIIRFYFNNPLKLRIGIYTDIVSKEMQRIPLDELNDLYKYADQIKKTIIAYESASQDGEPTTEAVEEKD